MPRPSRHTVYPVHLKARQGRGKGGAKRRQGKAGQGQAGQGQAGQGQARQREGRGGKGKGGERREGKGSHRVKTRIGVRQTVSSCNRLISLNILACSSSFAQTLSRIPPNLQ